MYWMEALIWVIREMTRMVHVSNDCGEMQVKGG